MEKADFVRLAPPYYAAAILYAMRKLGSNELHQSDVDAEFYSDNRTNPIRNKTLKKRAYNLLAEIGAIRILTDPFGPSMIEKTSEFAKVIEELIKTREGPYFRTFTERGRAYLVEALDNVNRQYDILKISDGDFSQPDAEWEPLPLDRQDPQLHRVTETLSETVRLVESDNGYAATLPGERDTVLTSLTTALKTFREGADISMGFVRVHAVEPLTRLTTRFGNAALGVAAQAARETLLKFLMDKFPQWMAFLQSLF